MSEQLYRISSNKIGADDEKIAELKADGILVPVVIDYEAAIESGLQVLTGVTYAQEIHDIVDAALGVADE